MLSALVTEAAAVVVLERKLAVLFGVRGEVSIEF